MTVSSRILAIDPGDKRIGLAISDPLRKIAGPLAVIEHISRQLDSARIAQFAMDNNVGLIIIGCPTDIDGNIGPQGRKSQKLLNAIQMQIDLPMVLWDESGSSEVAKQLIPFYGRGKSHKPNDDLAAVAILQNYLLSINE
jgi:putative Holliday junction resolvase